MPQHQDNSLRHVLARLRRSRSLSRDLRRQGPTPSGFPADAGEGPGDPGFTTVDATIRPVGSDRYRRLVWAPGEPHILRDDFGVRPSDDRVLARRSLLYFAHHTDVHICDAQSPARLEGGDVYGWVNPGADGGHRPQETCTTQVLDHLVVATNAVTTSPVSGASMAWCIHTGDNTDNRTTSEVRWWIDVLAGRTVTPNTGAPGTYEGVQRSGWRAAWQPDVFGGDRRQKTGYPHLPGFLDGAVAPFQPTGLDVPWLAVFGNHDSIFSGSFGPSRGPRIDRLEPMLAGTSRNPVTAQAMVRAILHATAVGPDTERWERVAVGPGVLRVTPDPDARRSLTVDEYLGQLLADGSDPDDPGPGPAGHGFSPSNLSDHTTWWSRPEGEHVQVIGLDTCNHVVGDAGCLGPAQTAWLESELIRLHSRYRDAAGRWVDGDGSDRLVILASHHSTWTIDNPHDDEFDPGPRTHGDDLIALIERFPNVIGWVNGHTHEHTVVSHRRGGSGYVASGWWEINTASAIDFAQQGRTVEVFDNGDGTVSILLTVLDHTAPPLVPYRSSEGWTPTRLASVSRELAANDDVWIDPISLLGEPTDRNVELPIRAPFPLS